MLQKHQNTLPTFVLNSKKTEYKIRDGVRRVKVFRFDGESVKNSVPAKARE